MATLLCQNLRAPVLRWSKTLCGYHKCTLQVAKQGHKGTRAGEPSWQPVALLLKRGLRTPEASFLIEASARHTCSGHKVSAPQSLGASVAVCNVRAARLVEQAWAARSWAAAFTAAFAIELLHGDEPIVADEDSFGWYHRAVCTSCPNPIDARVMCLFVGSFSTPLGA